MPTKKTVKTSKSTALGNKHKKPTNKKTTNKKQKIKMLKGPTAGDISKHLTVVDTNSASELKRRMSNGRVIVLFHAQWCGHCKDFMSEWQKFITIMKNKPDLNCATADIESSNLGLLPDADIEGFPTIRYYNADMTHRMPSEDTDQSTGLSSMFKIANNARMETSNANNSTVYSGPRNIKSLIEFIKKSQEQSGGNNQFKKMNPTKNVKRKHTKPVKAITTDIKLGDTTQLTPELNDSIKRLEATSIRATKTLREIKKSIGFKNK